MQLPEDIAVALVADDDFAAPDPNPEFPNDPPNTEKAPALGGAPNEADEDTGVANDPAFVLPESEEEAPNIERASELALGAAEDNCANANEGGGVIDAA